ncbi:hypothetical protein H2198_001791 [Neophaeococcomyces mojaviensis]|uniref:Uncharacterized protein n=1 Tax=Neophaeococcomyces mojaviensis TaxID=3383035 RepID=A0ACC3AG85_9EURO|nr:hypothetical protein H2198_001791 [Knufia sp. JES_112]
MPHRSVYDEDTENTPGMVRAPTMKETANQSDQRDWAPDRSPLQKLEVTLGSISKEEKRARVQEAEMLHMQKTRGQTAPERRGITSSRAQQPAPSVPTTIEDAGMVRSLSSTQKDRLHHSTIIESRKPDARHLSGGQKGFEYHVASPPARTVTITRTRGPTTVHHSRLDPALQRSTSGFQAQSRPDSGAGLLHTRSISETQSGKQRPSGEGRPSAMTQRVPQKQLRDPDPLPTAQERNASHRAALEQLTGNGPATGPRGLYSRPKAPQEEPSGRFGSQPQSAPFSTRETPATFKQEPVSSRLVSGNQPAIRTGTPQGQTIPIGLGAQQSPGVRSVDSAAPTVDPMQKQKRQSSVSFKEPYDRRRPIDEWKSAEIAQLAATDFLLQPPEVTEDADRDKAWWEQDSKSRRRSGRPRAATVDANAAIDDRIAEFKPRLLVKCGPLLRYTGIKRTVGEDAKEYWRGTVMLVTQDSQSSYEKPPILRLFAQPKSLLTRPVSVVEGEHLAPEHVDPIAGTIKMSRIGRALYVRPVDHLPEGKDLSQIETDDGLFESSPPVNNTDGQSVSVLPPVSRLSDSNGERCGKFKEIKGVRLYADPDRDVTFWLFKLEVQLSSQQQHIGYRINAGVAQGFWVPAEGETMNIMFHSCNGFSMSVKPDEFSGPDPLWRDVLNAHQSRPFHVMIGGGDQIYNDKIMNHTRYFGEWTANKNPHNKHHAPFTTEMKEELETFYFENYSRWFSQGLFSMANAQIPMVNMWDDHDIIDGFGSYPHPFMMSPVFSGVGNVAFKYYMLFQQHSVEGMTQADEPSWILGYKPGPYIKSVSRSIFLDLGRPVAFLALDCRTERMKNQVLSVDTCDVALERCRKEIIEGQTKHLLVLLGVPIAYPRMNWLENVLTSRAMDPVKAMGRYGLLKGGLLNKFDGGVEVLDDLDDHWTANHHKEERNEFVKELQDLAAERSVRVTILSGDVHLAAIGQFYSNPKLKIPKDRDHRYMPNIISSAIVNTPPPEMLADVLNKRNKVHHLDSYTEESMIPMFTHDVNMRKRNNKHLLPRRNWCSITEYAPGKTPPGSRSPSPDSIQYDEEQETLPQPKRRFSLSRDDVNPRMLFRRLSSRNAPPTAYREGGMYTGDEPQRASSFDGVPPGESQPRSWNQRLGLGRRTASETREPMADGDDIANGNSDARRPPPFRPGFHRRPTNMSEKAAKKGNVPAVDAEGNEIDVNGHVSLDGGLDIVLNCEIDQRDPSGITEPYRLLVPALWYDGSSDREKLNDTEGLSRKPTLLNRMGIGNRRGHKAAKNQGTGNWGQEISDTESYSGSEQDVGEKQKKKFGLFGSLRRKRPEGDLGQDYNLHDHSQGPTYMSGPNVPTATAPQDAATAHDRTTLLPGFTTTPKDTPPKLGFQAAPGSYDMPHDMPEVSQQTSPALFSSPSGQARGTKQSPPSRLSSFKGTNLLRKNSRKQAPKYQIPEPPTSNYRYEPQPQSFVEPSTPTTEHRNSYSIGADRPSTLRAQTNPDDVDTTHTPQQNIGRALSQNTTGSTAVGPPSSFPATAIDPSMASVQRASSSRSSNSSNLPGRHDAIPGIATNHDTFANEPQQHSLKGNGILGKNVAHSGNRPGQLHDDFEPQPPQRTMSEGYSGIEAYRNKPKRGLSLRDRARGFMDRFEGRRKYDDDDQYSYSEDEYSDDLGEEGVHSDGEASYVEGDDHESQKPKRGLSKRLREGMARMGKDDASVVDDGTGDERHGPNDGDSGETEEGWVI